MTELDPLQVNQLLYRSIGKLAKRLDTLLESDELVLTPPQLINALIAVGRIQIMFANLRKAETRERDSTASGSEVRKYQQAFAATAANRRRAGSGGPVSVDDDSVADDIAAADIGATADDEPAA